MLADHTSLVDKRKYLKMCLVVGGIHVELLTRCVVTGVDIVDRLSISNKFSRHIIIAEDWSG